MRTSYVFDYDSFSWILFSPLFLAFFLKEHKFIYTTTYIALLCCTWVVYIAPGVDSNWDDSPNVELIFVLDCSGSMSGAPIREAKRAMNLFLQSIQPGVAFNLYR